MQGVLPACTYVYSNRKKNFYLQCTRFIPESVHVDGCLSTGIIPNKELT